jgi:uncharacterized repeat protein (TIGR03806 family)
MKNKFLLLFFMAMMITVISCSDDDDNSPDTEEEYVPVSPVVLDVENVPYPKLSDYKFFEGELKNLKPSYKVLPFRPASELFTDYAQKSRFVWMPSGKRATFDGNANSLDFPVGAVLIKNFFYENVAPSGSTRIIETRLLIRKRNATTNDTGWEPYTYVWNDEQTEAYLDNGNGLFTEVTWTQNGEQRTVNYKIPSVFECRTCHKLKNENFMDMILPIGPKPQNLNFDYDYDGTTQNQISKWIAEGYLENAAPVNIHSTVDYRDASQPIGMRARSYLDANCAHCHRDKGQCDYMPMRMDFANADNATLGHCMVPILGSPVDYIIKPGDASRSDIIYRTNTDDGAIIMPLMGRSLIHTEGVDLLTQWINGMDPACP